MTGRQTPLRVNRRTLFRSAAAGLALPWAAGSSRLLLADGPLERAADEGYRGGVATGNATATEAGLAMLKTGGGAADAAVASLLVLSVIDPAGRELFCFGGEVPILVYDPAVKKVEVLAGQGAAPRLATRAYFAERGGIPGRGAEAAAVPAVLDACVTLLARYGTRSFAESAAPTMQLLEAGDGEWQQNLLKTFKALCAAESGARGGRAERLSAVSDLFYRGSIAKQIDSWSRKNGALLRYEDLAAHRTRIEQPLAADFLGHTIYKCGPWTQGPYLLQTLQLLEAIEEFDYRQTDPVSIHYVVEAMKLALADRDAYYADPLYATVPLRELFSSAYVALRRPLIDSQQASRELQPGDPGDMQPLLAGYRWDAAAGGPVHDTTNCIVADKEGQVVVATPSGWAGELAGETGVRLGSRLQSFNLWPNHPNCIAPGKRPRITLTPTLIMRDRVPVAGISVAGGDWQDQVALQLLLTHLVEGIGPREATAAARYGTRHLIGSFRQPAPQLANLTLDPRLAPKVAESLAARGHVIEVTGGPIGAPCMLALDPQTGRIQVAGDAATGRVAMAY